MYTFAPPIRSASFDQIRNLSRALRTFQNCAVGGSGITFTQFAILDLTSQRNPLHLKDLHLLLGVEKSTSSRLIKPLIVKQYIEKQHDPEDKRNVNLYLTEKGMEVYKIAWASVSEAIDHFFSAIPKTKQLNIASSLQIISQALLACERK